MRDRIRPSKEHDELLNQLRQDDIFATRQKAIMFAASLGYAIHCDESIETLEGFGEGIPLSVFSRAVDDGFIDALAVTVDGTLQVLTDECGDRRLDIFEHFARLGLERIRKACYEGGKDPLQGILDLIDQYRSSTFQHDALPGLEVSLRKLGQIM